MNRILLLLFLMGTQFTVQSAAHASSAYPSQPIHMIVPFSAGGPSDVLARTYAEGLGRLLGQTVIIENKPGAGGNIGTTYVAKAASDGYTLVLGMVGTHAINQSLYGKLPHDVITDFAPVSLVGNAPIVIVAHPEAGLKSLPDVLSKARAHPGELKFASPGAGTPQHLTGELLNYQANIKLDHIPYKGGAPALNDVLGGHVSIGIVSLPAALPHIRTGKIVAIGLASAERSPIADDIPTISEQGLSGFAVDNWYGIFAPAGTTQAIIDTLNRTLAEIASTPATNEQLSGAGFTPMHNLPAELAQYQREEVKKWRQLIQASGLTVD